MTESGHGDYGPGVARAKAMCKASGYADGGAVDHKVKRGVHQHERALHKGQPKTKLKLKAGGRVEGEEAEERPDRRARGGATKAKGTTVNIMVGKGDDDQQGDQMKQQMAAKAGLQKGVQLGAQMAGRGAPPGAGMPPPGGMPPGALPPPSGPGVPPMMPPRKRGGALEMHAGAGSGLGRLEKAKAYGTMRRGQNGRFLGGGV